MNPQLITEVVALILQGGPIALDLFLKLESLLHLGPDEKTNIANAIAAADSANQDTINKIGAWMSANGFKAQVTFIKA